MSSVPNFLFLLTDQHRFDHTGFGGNPVVRTPHLDGLAARATSFERCLVANPTCMPNRASLLTGRMPSSHGLRHNGIPLEPTTNTFVRELRRRGFTTAHIGKLHLQTMKQGMDLVRRATASWAPGDAIASPHPPGWDELESFDRHRREEIEMPKDFYGFDEVDLLLRHAGAYSGHYYHWLAQQGADLSVLEARPAKPEVPLVWPPTMPVELHPNTYIASKATAFLERAAKQSSPFFLHASFMDPHPPYDPPAQYAAMYSPDEIPLPATFADPHEASPRHFKRMIAARGRQDGFIAVAPFAATEHQYRVMAAREYGMVSFVDDAIGRILGTLEATGLAANTVVVFTSDHGDMFGDHGIMMKGAMHYEGCLRVPLLVARPGAVASRSKVLASSIDVAPTLLELAGITPYHGIQGTSLVPVLEDPGVAVRDHVLVEEQAFYDMLGIGAPLKMRTLVTADARLTLYDGIEEGELFDLRADPEERNNLFADAGASGLKATMMELLVRKSLRYVDESPRPTATV